MVFNEYVRVATAVTKSPFKMTGHDQLLLTLIRLCQGSLLIDLALRFHASTAVVSKFFHFG